MKKTLAEKLVDRLEATIAIERELNEFDCGNLLACAHNHYDQIRISVFLFGAPGQDTVMFEMGKTSLKVVEDKASFDVSRAKHRLEKLLGLK